MSFQPAALRTTEADWLTLGQAARFLGVAQSTIRKWSDSGRVPAFYTPGGHRRFRRADLKTFIEQSRPAHLRVPL
jgi:excisionase family DNA binding protein